MPTTKSKKKSKKQAKKTTHIVLILDETGSMSVIRKQAIDGFNEQLKTIEQHAKKGGDTWVHWWSFSDLTDGSTPRIRENARRAKAGEIEPLTNETYMTSGSTPLFDAVGHALAALEKEESKGDVGFLVCIISDGQENSSKEYTSQQIAARVKDLQATGKWTFAYIGANQDLADVSRHLGIPMANTINWQSTPEGAAAMAVSNKRGLANYLSGRAVGMTATVDYQTLSSTDPDEYEKQLHDDANTNQK